MASKKPMVIDVVMRSIGARLGVSDRPRFSDTTLAVGDWQGMQVEAQFDSAFLHGLAGPYWVRLELSRTGRTHCLVHFHGGGLGIVAGGAHDTPAYSADLEFTDVQDLELLLGRAGDLIKTWSPESETA